MKVVSMDSGLTKLYLLMCKWIFSIFLVANTVPAVFLRVSNNAFYVEMELLDKQERIRKTPTSRKSFFL